MRIRRGESGRRVIIGVAGIAASMIGGVAVGRTAIGDLNLAYSARSATGRPWKSPTLVSNTEYVPVSQPLYASSQPLSTLGGANPYSNSAMLEPAPSAWEQKLNAEYARWQAKLDRDLRSSSDPEAAPALSIGSRLPASQPIELTIASEKESAAIEAPAQSPSTSSPAENAHADDAPPVRQAL